LPPERRYLIPTLTPLRKIQRNHFREKVIIVLTLLSALSELTAGLKAPHKGRDLEIQYSSLACSGS